MPITNVAFTKFLNFSLFLYLPICSSIIYNFFVKIIFPCLSHYTPLSIHLDNSTCTKTT